jgi:hypothetical protein
MSEEIEIPASAWKIKAVFPTRPGDEVIAEIKAYIRDFGTPYLWRGHSHAPPPKDSPVVYLDEINLPRSHAGDMNRHKWSPCPICSPRFPKFYKAGMIAWFPDEQAIRIIGPECFASFNFAGHSAAYDAFRKAQQEKRTLVFLLSHLGEIGKTIAIIEHNFEAIREIDRVREIIARRIPIMIDFDLWRHVRGDQQLRSECERRIISKDRYGEEREIAVRESNIYGPINGHIMLEPKAKTIYDRLKICHTRLRITNDRLW